MKRSLTYSCSACLMGLAIISACQPSTSSVPTSAIKAQRAQSQITDTEAKPADPKESVLAVGRVGDDGQVSDDSGFGVRDSRGAYQEVRIKPVYFDVGYFSRYEQELLQQNAEEQIKYGIWPDADAKVGHWGHAVELTFQDGELKTRNPDSTVYHQLDTTRTYAVVYAVLAFDNLKAAKTGVYKVDGIVTLVTGQFQVGPVDAFGKPTADYHQSAVEGYIQSGAYEHDCNPNCIVGGQFNQFGNGKNDGGRITEVGLVSTDPTPLSVGELKNAMGALVEVVYPSRKSTN